MVAAAHARGRHRESRTPSSWKAGWAAASSSARRAARSTSGARSSPWEPPSRVGYTWHPGRGEETAQEVEVTFTPEGDGTRVDIRHWGWEKLGDRLDETIASYNEGWDMVLAVYARAAERS